MDKIDKLWRKKAELREGVRYNAYLDSLGKPTGGIGHLLTRAELQEYKVGDPIAKTVVERWFYQDSAWARRAAEKQAKEIGIETDWFIVALISVNFQLGSNWTRTFKTTYPAIVRHDYDTAIRNLRRSKWYRQTPVRVEDFIEALERAKLFKQRPLPKTRTMQGAGVATVGTAGTAASEVIAEATEKIEPLAPYSDGLQYLFIILALIGIGLTIYARIDDRKKGHR